MESTSFMMLKQLRIEGKKQELKLKLLITDRVSLEVILIN